jgi:hypothetical protein
MRSPVSETDNKSPTEHSTRPLGNTAPERPDPLARIINTNAAAKLKQHNPDAVRAVDEMLDRKYQQGGGHARD